MTPSGLLPARMNDADPKLSKLSLASTTLLAALNLAPSLRTRGPKRSAAFAALAVGLPAAGELLATGPLGLLRHRTRPKISGVPLSILLGWYCAIHGSYSIADRLLPAAGFAGASRKRPLPATAALVGTSLDLLLDPAGLDMGLWEWNVDGAYAREIRGANGRGGVPLVNYLGWISLISSVVALHERTVEDPAPPNLLPALSLLPPYLAAAAWAIKRRKIRYLLFSLPFPISLLLATLSDKPNSG